MPKFETVHLEKYVCVADFEADAFIKLPKLIWDYYSSGSDDEQTLKRNIKALKKYKKKKKILLN